MKSVLLIALSLAVAPSVYATQLRCSASAPLGMFSGVVIDLDRNASLPALERIQGVYSLTGGYGALELKDCKITDSGGVQCRGGYFRLENGQPVNHSVTIYLNTPLEESRVVRDMTDGRYKLIGEELINCMVL